MTDQEKKFLDELPADMILEVKAVQEGGELSDELYDVLFDSPLAADMPYGTAKARTGDPFVWLTEKLRS